MPYLEQTVPPESDDNLFRAVLVLLDAYPEESATLEPHEVRALYQELPVAMRLAAVAWREKR